MDVCSCGYIPALGGGFPFLVKMAQHKLKRAKASFLKWHEWEKQREGEEIPTVRGWVGKKSSKPVTHATCSQQILK